MVNKKYLIKVFGVLTLLLMLMSTVAFAAEGVPKVSTFGQIDWQSKIIEATGTGLPPANAPTPGHARVLARRAAVVDAYRNLAEIVEGIQVSSEGTIGNLVVSDDVIRTKVSSTIKGARIIRENYNSDGSYEVAIAINLFGENSIAAAVLENKQVAPQPFPQPSQSYKPQTTVEGKSPVVITPVYTGLVVDARGLQLERAMSPLVYDDSGRIVYGNMYVDSSFVVNNGMVDYGKVSDDISAMDLSRAGSNPITVKAVNVRDHNVNVVISKDDADKILASNAQGKFLQNLKVVFVQ